MIYLSCINGSPNKRPTAVGLVEKLVDILELEDEEANSYSESGSAKTG